MADKPLDGLNSTRKKYFMVAFTLEKIFFGIVIVFVSDLTKYSSAIIMSYSFVLLLLILFKYPLNNQIFDSK